MWLFVWRLCSNFAFASFPAPKEPASFCGQVLLPEPFSNQLLVCASVFTGPNFLSFNRGSWTLMNLEEASRRHRSCPVTPKNC